MLSRTDAVIIAHIHQFQQLDQYESCGVDAKGGQIEGLK